MNRMVEDMVREAISCTGIENIVDEHKSVDLFSDDFLAELETVKMPITKFNALLKLLKKAIAAYGRTNKVKAIEFDERLRRVVDEYNSRDMDSMGSEGFSILPFPNCGEQADPGQSRYMVDINHTLTPGLCISSQTEQPDLAAQLCLLFAREVNKRNVTQYGYLDLMENSGLQMPEQLSPPAEQFHSMMDQAVHYMPLWYAVLEKEDGDSWRNMTKKLLGRSIDIQTFIRESERYLNFTS